MTRNEAAERLREHMVDFHGNCPWVGEDHIPLLDEALAAERRAKVERIAKRLYGLRSYLGGDGRHSPWVDVKAILVEEGATPHS